MIFLCQIVLYLIRRNVLFCGGLRCVAASILVMAFLLVPGCALKKPPPEVTSPPRTRELEYSVREGDTLTGIAARFHSDPSRSTFIARHNDLGSGEEEVLTGQMVRIPFTEEEYARFRKLVKARTAYNRGLFFAEKEDYERAIGEFRKAIEHSPYFVSVYHDLGVAYWRAGRTEEAIRILKHGLGLEPENDHLHHALATIYYRSGLTSLALEEFRESVTLNPENQDSLYAYALVLEEAGQQGKALETLDRFICSFPDSSRIGEARRKRDELSSTRRE